MFATPLAGWEKGPLEMAGDGVRSRYQPPPALFLFDRCVAPLATSLWSLSPAPHGSGDAPP